MSQKQVVIAFSVLITFLLIFQNCGQGFEKTSGTSQDSQSSARDSLENLEVCDNADCRIEETEEVIISPAGPCVFQGVAIANGDSITAYLESEATSCTREIRQCDSGVLSGTYPFATCTEKEPTEITTQSCLFNGNEVLHGGKVLTYRQSSVSLGSMCESQERVCNNGILSGTFQFSQCSVDTPKSCLFDGSTIEHNSSVVAYMTSSAPANGECVKQDRLCQNGVLTGSYLYSRCSVDQPESCLFNGSQILHSQSVVAFKNANPAAGSDCEQETRSCTDGTLSGSYPFSTCSTTEPASCQTNGQTLPHGGSIELFEKDKINNGESCQKQTRVCDNGNLSGTYTFATCTPPVYGIAIDNEETLYYEQDVVIDASTHSSQTGVPSQFTGCLATNPVLLDFDHQGQIFGPNNPYPLFPTFNSCGTTLSLSGGVVLKSNLVIKGNLKIIGNLIVEAGAKLVLIPPEGQTKAKLLFGDLATQKPGVLLLQKDSVLMRFGYYDIGGDKEDFAPGAFIYNGGRMSAAPLFKEDLLQKILLEGRIKAEDQYLNIVPQAND